MKKWNFIVVGSGGGGGTIAWLLAKRGFSVLLLEQGADPLEGLDPKAAFDARFHDEYRWRIRRPIPTRRPAWDYTTFFDPSDPGTKPKPIANSMGGWTSSVLGGGSVGWGVWSLRPLPVDFALADLLQAKEMQGLDGDLATAGYAVENWPIRYSELAPYYDVAEALFAVSGDRKVLFESIKHSKWFDALKLHTSPEFKAWFAAPDFPLPAFPVTPVGAVIAKGFKHPCPLPVGIVRPGTQPYCTREVLWRAWQGLPSKGARGMPATAEQLWSSRVRNPCNLCGFCGEYVCWGGHEGPKSGTRVTVLEELMSAPTAEIRTHAKAFQLVHDLGRGAASGVRYVDITDRANPVTHEEHADHVIVSCGAIQTARLLLLSELGSAIPKLGRHAMFHMFGLAATAVFSPDLAGLLRHEFGPTGNTASYERYFLTGTFAGREATWLKGGILASTASKNPLEAAWGKAYPSGAGPLQGRALLDATAENARKVSIRITGDDLPHPDNRVVLDPKYVDEFGFPVARIVRSKRAYEKAVEQAAMLQLKAMFDPVAGRAAIDATPMDLQLLGDHQLGTCRMGDDPQTSVVDRDCRLHALKNVFVVDTSFMPTGCGVNPMMTVVANALRVGSIF
jgi:choline dehydrogenase-like flavoprotein